MKICVTLYYSEAYGGTPCLWVIKDEPGITAGIYYDDAGQSPVVSGQITMPRVECLSVLGYYLDDTQMIDAAGNIVTAAALFDLTGPVTLFPRTERVSWRISLDHGGGTSETGAIYSKVGVGGIYADDQCTDGPIANIELPMRPTWKTTGYYYIDVQYITGIDCEITSLLQTAVLAQDYVLTARWERTYYVLTLDPAGGSGGVADIYYEISTGLYYYAPDSSMPLDRFIDVPTRDGYAFGGFYYGAFCAVDADGLINVDLYSMTLAADYVLTARWTANTYTITFDYNGGTGSVRAKAVTFAERIGVLPAASRANFTFMGWTYMRSVVSEATPYVVPGDVTLVASWTATGGVVDYFGIGSDALVPFASDSGESLPHVVTRAYGRSVASASGTVKWRNPTVRYMVVRDTSLRIDLGKGYPAEYSAGTKTKTGFMSVSCSIETAIGQFPVVTMSAVANEGDTSAAHAINRFVATVSLHARARPQDTASAFSVDGELLACTTTYRCTPVVLSEGLQPSASDVVEGCCEANVTVRETRPNATTSAAVGFMETASATVRAGTDMWTHTATARKELV